MISPDTFVSIDIETTGLDPNINEIIEVGAVKVEHGKITAEYSELVKPSHPIPEFITHITGITNEEVQNAGTIDDVIPSFLDFISGFRLLGQNVGFDVAFLRRAAGIGKIGMAVNNISLARILLPCLPSYSLDSLIDFFALKPEKRHRALDDAQITAVIFLKLIDMLRMVPVSFLNEMLSISSRTDSLLKDVFEAQYLERANEPLKRTEKHHLPVLKLQEKSNNIFGDFSRNIPSPPESETITIDPKSVASLLSKGGKLNRNYDSYEERPGQITFAKKVATAFNDSEILLAEAGTGTGKSIAYLLPAILWAEAARERVVISTNTKNLQEQLFSKDIPLISRILDFPFRAVILKGRGNYICLHRWQRLVDTSERYLSKQESDLILPTASWLHTTTTGDLSETGFFSMLAESGLLERINSDPISCIGTHCPSREQCFVNRIRRAAQRAHIIIVNHSLIFSDMITEGGVLGSYTSLVFDEAHNIEKVALNYLGVSMNYYRVRRIVNRLYLKDGDGHGLFAKLAVWMEDMTKGWPEYADNAATVALSTKRVQHLRSVTINLFEHLYAAVRFQETSVEYGNVGKLRYDEKTPVFSDCVESVEEFNESMSALITSIENIIVLLSGVSSNQLDDKEEIITELEKSKVDLQTVINDFEFLITAGGRNVFWFEYNVNGTQYSLKVLSAPLDVAEKLAVGIYDHMETVIMTSATLSVAHNFSYIRNRLGLNLDSKERVTEFIASSPFDYKRQSVVVTPTFLPSPKNEIFIEKTNEALLALAGDVSRGMLVLFTSRGHLQRAYYELRDTLMRSGITLLGQGIDGSRNMLLRRFREETSSVLFGTDSFWEGVDVPGKALELVVIVRLPFAVPTEPIVQAQMEEIERDGGQPFLDYSVPEAEIKLRQGAGRLIRRKSDKGAVIIMDTRIVTTRYGQIFRQSLPGSSMRVQNLDGLVGGLKAWFG